MRGGCDPKIGTQYGVFGWTETSSSFTLPSGAGTITGQGKVVFDRPDHLFTLAIIDPIITIDSAGDAIVSVHVDLDSTFPGTSPVDERMDFGAFELTNLQVTATTVTWDLGNGMITDEAAGALGSFLPAGSALDPIRIILPVPTSTTSSTSSSSTSTSSTSSTSLPPTVDQPRDAVKVLLKARNGKEKLVWVSKAPALTLPAGDPAVSGASLEISNPVTLETATLQLPASGWSANGTNTVFKFKNPDAPTGTPVKVAILKATLLKVVAKGTGITLDEATQGNIEISLTVGTDRYCSSCSTPTKAEGAAGPEGQYLAKSCEAPPSCP